MTVTLEQIRDAVAAEYGITVEQLASYRIGVPYGEARKVFASIAWKHGTATPKEIGSAVKRGPTWFSKHRNYRSPLPEIESRIMRRLSPDCT